MVCLEILLRSPRTSIGDVPVLCVCVTGDYMRPCLGYFREPREAGHRSVREE